MSPKLKQLKEKLRRAIRKELVEYDNLNIQSEEELEEASMTGNLDGGEGPPQTPYAFQSKKKRAQDKKKEDEIVTNSTGFIKVNETLNDRGVKEFKRELTLDVKYVKALSKLINKKSVGKATEKDDQVISSLTNILQGRFSGLANILKNKNLNEGRYHTWRNDESITPKQKIGRSIREVRDSLNSLSKTIDMSVKLKNELKVNSSDYWKTTHNALGKMSERLVKLANKVGKLQ